MKIISAEENIKYAGAAVAIGTIAAVGYGLYNYYRPSEQPRPTTTPVGKKERLRLELQNH